MTIQFQQYKKLIDKEAYRIAYKYPNMDIDDVQSQGYLLFVEAVKQFNPDRQIKFSTYLMHRLKRLYQYCYSEFCEYKTDELFPESSIINFSDFEEALNRIESLITLSKEAQEMLYYFLDFEWYVPGISKKRPYFKSTAQYFKDRYNWSILTIRKAWEELKQWWIHEPFMT